MYFSQLCGLRRPQSRGWQTQGLVRPCFCDPLFGTEALHRLRLTLPHSLLCVCVCVCVYVLIFFFEFLKFYYVMFLLYNIVNQL